jgi:hypothetical protein
LCGGLIHPVAGRCKHCKEDLSTYRAGRPQAAAALPALNSGPIISKPSNGSNGHVVPAPIPVVVATAHEVSQPILPPRTTARSVKVARPPSMWRSWPMLVIALAVIAIVAATVIMILPQGNKHADGKMSAPPAPERMQMNPLPEPDQKHGQNDPWAKPDPGAPAAPLAPQPPDPDDPDDNDIWRGTPGGPSGGTLGGGGTFGSKGAQVQLEALVRACSKLKSCPNLDQSDFSAVCDAVAMMPRPPAVTGCAAAQRCYNAIDKMSCDDASNSSPHSVLRVIQDCAEATNC